MCCGVDILRSEYVKGRIALEIVRVFVTLKHIVPIRGPFKKYADCLNCTARLLNCSEIDV